MNGKYQRPFVYGIFRWPRRTFSLLGRIGAPPPGEPDIALEVLREFGTTELIGKVYIKAFVSTSWMPAQWDLIQQVDWYQGYLQTPQYFLFDMAGSGTWEVVHFRTETDETGPYVSVAIKYLPKAPAWVQNQRDRERPH